MAALKVFYGKFAWAEQRTYRPKDFGIDIEHGLNEVPHQFPDRYLAVRILLPTVGAVLAIVWQRVMAIGAIAGGIGGPVLHSESKYGLKIVKICRIAEKRAEIALINILSFYNIATQSLFPTARPIQLNFADI